MTQPSLEQLYSSVCGLRVGDSFFKSLAVSILFGRVAIYPEFLLLEIRYAPPGLVEFLELNALISRYKTTRYPREIRLAYHNITRLKLHTFITYGITVEHNDPIYPPYIQFHVFEKKAYKLLNELYQQHHS